MNNFVSKIHILISITINILALRQKTPTFRSEKLKQTRSTSKNQSYSEKKRGRSNRSETAPSAMGIDPTLPPLNKFVRKLLALSSTFLLDFFLSVSID